MSDTFVNFLSGEQIVLQIGNGATPEVFSASCTINTTRGLTGTAKFSTTEIADCTTPSNPAQTVRQVQSVDCAFDGAGIADGPSLLAMLNWNQSGGAKNCKIIFNMSGANGGFTVSVPMVMESWASTGARGDKATFTGKWSQASAPTSIVANA